MKIREELFVPSTFWRFRVQIFESHPICHHNRSVHLNQSQKTESEADKKEPFITKTEFSHNLTNSHRCHPSQCNPFNNPTSNDETDFRIFGVSHEPHHRSELSSSATREGKVGGWP
jgi:hypothetical protein